MTNKEASAIINREMFGILSDGFDFTDEQCEKEFENAVRVAIRALESIDKIKDEAERVKADNIILTKRLDEANRFLKTKTTFFDCYRDGYKSGFDDGFVQGLELRGSPIFDREAYDRQMKLMLKLNGEIINGNQEGTK